MDNQRDWKEMAQKAANEQDPKKLLAIIQELNQALEEREKQLHPKKREGGNELLFVDDEPSIRLTLPPILQEHGFHVQVEANVSEALAAIKARRFDVLLSDINIDRESDGFTVVHAMREANPRLRNYSLDGIPSL
jgi:PleD family two-component response regulator